MKKQNKVQRKKDPLIGKFFHSFTKDRKLSWQGHVVTRVRNNDLYIVQLFEWWFGESSAKELVPVEGMVGWSFYDSAQEMNDAYDVYRKGKNNE
jgi:hypothetical protein